MTTGERTDLYRFYDRQGRLLYVGISLSAAQRASQHRAEKAWWPDVARMDIDHLSSREAALEAEREAIAREKPIHNVIHNSRPSPTSNAFEQPWRCQRCNQRIRGTKERGYLQIDTYDIWRCFCRECDDDPCPRYWIDTLRVKTLDDIDRWTNHLVCKNWFSYDDWLNVLKSACLIPSAHETARYILDHRRTRRMSYAPLT